MLKHPQENDDSPVTFINTKQLVNDDSSRFIPSPMAHSKKHSQLSESPASSPAEILQDVLMSKTSAMQLKPPPIRNPIAAAAAAAASSSNKPVAEAIMKASPSKQELMTPVIKPDKVSSELRIPTIGTGSSLNSPKNVIILPPRTPTIASPLRALIVSQWKLSGQSMMKHVSSILSNIVSRPDGSKDHHYQIDMVSGQIEAMEKLTDPGTAPYDYIMINLASEQQILLLTKAICGSLNQQQANALVVTTPIQRSQITESAKGREDEVIPKKCGFVFKPLKRSKLQWYFGVRQQNEMRQSNSNTTTSGTSTTLTITSNISTPDTPYKRAATQKEIFKRMNDDVGSKGYKVLLVEGKS